MSGTKVRQQEIRDIKRYAKICDEKIPKGLLDYIGHCIEHAYSMGRVEQSLDFLKRENGR